MSQRPSRSKPASKTVYALASPYPQAEWPTLSHHHQTTVLELLCRSVCCADLLLASSTTDGSRPESDVHGSLLTPVGDHRRNFIAPSKGKRNRKRKRAPEDGTAPSIANTLQHPDPPAIAHYIKVGFNGTMRFLESTIRPSPPEATTQEPVEAGDAVRSTVAAIFVDRIAQPPELHSNLPSLVWTSSSANPSGPPIRLVPLPRGAQDRLSAALHVPRAGILALPGGTPGAGPLIDFIRQHVPPVEVPWQKDLQKGVYLPVQIDAKRSSIPAKKTVRDPKVG